MVAPRERKLPWKPQLTLLSTSICLWTQYYSPLGKINRPWPVVGVHGKLKWSGVGPEGQLGTLDVLSMGLKFFKVAVASDLHSPLYTKACHMQEVLLQWKATLCKEKRECEKARGSIKLGRSNTASGVWWGVGEFRGNMHKGKTWRPRGYWSSELLQCPDGNDDTLQELAASRCYCQLHLRWAKGSKARHTEWHQGL